MKHFWMNTAEQATMDIGTSTAEQYGYIASLNASKHKEVEAAIGGTVKADDIIRVHPLVHQTKYYFGDRRQRGLRALGSLGEMRVRTIVRVTDNQALLLKLSNAPDSTEAQLRADPTGENWGNLLMGQFSVLNASAESKPYAKRDCQTAIQSLMLHRETGPTIATVGSFADVLPVEWRAAFVWEYKNRWHEAQQFVRPLRSFETGTIEYLEEQHGTRWAQAFHACCQKADFRANRGIA